MFCFCKVIPKEGKNSSYNFQLSQGIGKVLQSCANWPTSSLNDQRVLFSVEALGLKLMDVPANGVSLWYLWVNLRTVLTFVTAHTFYTSRDTQVPYGWCLLIQGYFCAVLNYAEKAELSKCSWYPKRKLRITVHFSEIIKLQYGKNARHYFVFSDCFL